MVSVSTLIGRKICGAEMFGAIGLPLAFFLTAALYASVGFGGGSTYTALLVLSVSEIWAVPILSLSCNILVVAMGSYWAVSRRSFDWRQAAPFLLSSVPFAFIGGFLPLRDNVYLLLLALSLLAAGLRLLFITDQTPIMVKGKQSPALAFGIGSGLGLLSGMVGIGGGIFLAPILHYLRWSDAKSIAALASFFILVNSLSGLAGQLAKTGPAVVPELAETLLPLLVMVWLGAILGGRVLLERFSQSQMRKITALLIIFVAGRLFYHLYFTS